MYMEQVIQIRKCVVCVVNFIDILMDVCLMSECVNKTMFFCYLFACVHYEIQKDLSMICRKNNNL